MNKYKIFGCITCVGLGILAVGAFVRRKRAIRDLQTVCCCDCGCYHDDDGDGNPCHMACAGMAGEDDFDDEAMAEE